MTTRIYMDSEFTGLQNDAKLISLALVAESGEHIYCELSDTWCPLDCSDWVQEHVLTKLDKTDAVVMSSARAEAEIRGFLGRFESAVVCFDSDWDRKMLLGLLGSLPAGVQIENIEDEIDQLVRDGYWSGAERFRHNALTDSRALAYCHAETLRLRVEEMRAGYDIC